MLHNSTPSFRLLLVAMAKFGGLLLGYLVYTLLPLRRPRSWSLETFDRFIARPVAAFGWLSASVFTGGLLLRRPVELGATPRRLAIYHSCGQAGRL